MDGKINCVSWTRRHWLKCNTVALVAGFPFSRSGIVGRRAAMHVPIDPATAVRVAAHAECIDPGPLQQLVLRAVDVACNAGAQYADVRITRTVGHEYGWHSGCSQLSAETEVQGVGVRVLFDGYWGFAAASFWDSEAIGHLALDAVAQAKVNAKVSTAGNTHRAPRTVSMGHALVAVGTWATPVEIDPFTISVEEKMDYIQSWMELVEKDFMYFAPPFLCGLTFVRQERIMATSDGTLVMQTIYESGGGITATSGKGLIGVQPTASVSGLQFAGRGWEMILDAKVSEQLAAMPATLAMQSGDNTYPSTVGRYTLVCDGTTMASLLASTLGIATQLDRALGYEANARGTSYINDPLSMVGQLQVAAPMVNVTANRSVPTQLATVRWDDEGILPQPFTLVKNGILVDFQTTREQAAWLTPYYERHGRPARSNGCAASEDALVTTLQMMPNLALEPSPVATRLDDLVADVKDGLLITRGDASADFQGRNGLLGGEMRQIKNGRLGRRVSGGAVLFNSLDIWRKIVVMGGPATIESIAKRGGAFQYGGHGQEKGEPSQQTNYSVQAVAATITDQSLIRGRGV